MLFRVANLALDLSEVAHPVTILADRAAQRLGVDRGRLRSIRVVRRSLDARGRRPPHWVLTVEVELAGAAPEPLPGGVSPVRPAPALATPRLRRPDTPPVIVGAGPAGLFCALALADAGIPCVVLERGRATGPRKRDVARLYRSGDLDPDSNVSFGEGGAGTFTDGKLSTRVRDPEVREVLEILVAHGADSDILVTNKPHLGSERLPGIIEALRRHLLDRGCDLRFETRALGLAADGRVRGVRLAGGEVVESDRVVLAVGNAARELYEGLARVPGLMVPKAFATGLRVEHPQALVDEIQYGRAMGHPMLPPADYKLTAQAGGRGVYAFCMCPGGVVVPTPTEEGLLCINGMSNSRRSSPWANSALVAQVGPDDFEAAGFGRDVLAGVRFQQAVERAAYEAGGGAYAAPAQRLTDFLGGRVRPVGRRTSYPRGAAEADLRRLYPERVTRALDEAVRRFGRMMRGFVTDEALLLGAETRTSAPLSFPRGPDLMSPALPGLYPCGEGCGHAGGIVSAAIDGLRVARRILAELA